MNETASVRDEDTKGTWLHVPNDLNGAILSYYVPPLISKLQFKEYGTLLGQIEQSPTSFDLWWLAEAARGLDDNEIPNLNRLNGMVFRNAFETLRGKKLSIEQVRHAAASFSPSNRPADFRQGLHWVGGTLDEHRFVPPPTSALPALTSDFFSFSSREDVERTSQAVVAFTQFALIHPFRDCNGRMARLIACKIAFGEFGHGLASAMVALLTFWRRDFFLTHQFAARNGYDLSECRSLWDRAHQRAEKILRTASLLFAELLIDIEAVIPRLETRLKIFHFLLRQPNVEIPVLSNALTGSIKVRRFATDRLLNSGWLVERDHYFFCERVAAARKTILDQLTVD